MSDETATKLTYTAMALSVLLILMTCYGDEPEPCPNPMETMKLDQIERIIDPAPGRDTIYTILGVETEGRYFWFCDGAWVEIDPPCAEFGVTPSNAEPPCVPTPSGLVTTGPDGSVWTTVNTIERTN